MMCPTSNSNPGIDMKNSLLLRALTLLTGVALAVAARTADAKLTVGDPAPKLQVAKWVQGDPVKAFDTNHVYIVEFWATWCGPCRASIPHLNELSKKFKDQGVIAIGQDVWDQDDGVAAFWPTWCGPCRASIPHLNELSKKFKDQGVIAIGQDVWDQDDGVAAFVKKMGDQMTYRVALDDKSQETNGIMAVNWMKAAEQNGIPTAFVINKQGRIAWIGHPMGLDEKTLEEILADKFDIAAFAAEYERQHQAQKQDTELRIKLPKALKNKDWDGAEAAVAEMKKSEPAMGNSLDTVRFSILLGRKNYAEEIGRAHV